MRVGFFSAFLKSVKKFNTDCKETLHFPQLPNLSMTLPENGGSSAI